MPVFRRASDAAKGGSFFELMNACLQQIAEAGQMKVTDILARNQFYDRKNKSDHEQFTDTLLSLGGDPLVAVHIHYTEAVVAGQFEGYVMAPSFQGAGDLAGAAIEKGAGVLAEGLDRLSGMLKKQVASEKASAPAEEPKHVYSEATWKITFRWAATGKQEQWTGDVLHQGDIDVAFDRLVTAILDVRKAAAEQKTSTEQKA